MAKVFSSYVPETLPFLGGTVDLLLRALGPAEARTFRAAVESRFSDVAKAEGETTEEHTARMEAKLPKWNAFVRETFARTYKTKKGEERGYYVRLAEPLENDEDPDDTIADALALYERAPHDFRFAVMLKLATLAALGDTDAKSSGSLSTSTVEAGQPTASSDSPAATLVIVPSRPSSTAPETIESDLYSQPV